MTRPAGSLAYNPALLSDEDTKALFVARIPLLERTTAALREAARGGSSPHTLLVGQRGMGKTLLLRRLRTAVEDEPALSERFLALSFPEEQYNVARLSDFWANCLDALADGRARAGDDAGAARIDAIVAALPAAEDERANATLAALVSEARGRRLLLLVDNLDLVLDRLKGDHWRIREVLSQPGGLVLVGATSAVHDATSDYGEAFYDFFTVEDLGPLSFDEAEALFRALAVRDGGEAVLARLRDDPGAFGAFHTLTGGNPRTMVLLFDLLARGSDNDVHHDLERLLDVVTPLYKARFEEMSPQAQQIVDALALIWDPAPAVRVAERARLDTSLVSAQLQRLVHAGIVEKVELPDGSRTGYQIAERFFNLWYLMRASRRLRQRLVWLTRFLHVVHGQTFREYALRIVRAQDADPTLLLAMARGTEEPGLRTALERRALARMLADPAMWQRFDLDGEDRDLGEALRTLQAVAFRVHHDLASGISAPVAAMAAAGRLFAPELADASTASAATMAVRIMALLSVFFGVEASQSYLAACVCGDVIAFDSAAGAEALDILRGPGVSGIARALRGEPSDGPAAFVARSARATPDVILQLRMALLAYAETADWPATLPAWVADMLAVGEIEVLVHPGLDTKPILTTLAQTVSELEPRRLVGHVLSLSRVDDDDPEIAGLVAACGEAIAHIGARALFHLAALSMHAGEITSEERLAAYRLADPALALLGEASRYRTHPERVVPLLCALGDDVRVAEAAMGLSIATLGAADAAVLRVPALHRHRPITALGLRVSDGDPDAIAVLSVADFGTLAARERATGRPSGLAWTTILHTLRTTQTDNFTKLLAVAEIALPDLDPDLAAQIGTFIAAVRALRGESEVPAVADVLRLGAGIWFTLTGLLVVGMSTETTRLAPLVQALSKDLPTDLLGLLAARARTFGPADVRLLIESADLVDVLRPVYAAVVAATDGPQALRGFAPEVRAAAQQWISAVEPGQPRTTAPTRKPKGRRRR